MKSRGHGDRLSEKCHLAVAALLSQPTIKAAARQVGLSEKQLRRWLRIPEFAELLRASKQQVFDHALGRLQALTTDAVAVLAAVLRKRRGDTGARLKAAGLVLGNGLKVAELTDLAERLAAIEAELAKPNRSSSTHTNGRVNGRAKA
jgi:transposase-like protein